MKHRIIWFLIGISAVGIVYGALALNSVQQQINEKSGQAVEVLDLRIDGYNAAEAYIALNAMGQEARTIYRNAEMSIDILYPISWALLLFSITLLFSPKNSYRDILLAFPAVYLISDIAENVHIISMIDGFPNNCGDGVFTILKWGFAFLSLASVVLLMVYHFSCFAIEKIKARQRAR